MGAHLISSKLNAKGSYNWGKWIGQLVNPKDLDVFLHKARLIPARAQTRTQTPTPKMEMSVLTPGYRNCTQVSGAPVFPGKTYVRRDKCNDLFMPFNISLITSNYLSVLYII